eukprot:gene16232-biopygen3755
MVLQEVLKVTFVIAISAQIMKAGRANARNQEIPWFWHLCLQWARSGKVPAVTVARTDCGTDCAAEQHTARRPENCVPLKMRSRPNCRRCVAALPPITAGAPGGPGPVPGHRTTEWTVATEKTVVPAHMTVGIGPLTVAQLAAAWTVAWTVAQWAVAWSVDRWTVGPLDRCHDHRPWPCCGPRWAVAMLRGQMASTAEFQLCPLQRGAFRARAICIQNGKSCVQSAKICIQSGKFCIQSAKICIQSGDRGFFFAQAEIRWRGGVTLGRGVLKYYCFLDCRERGVRTLATGSVWCAVVQNTRCSAARHRFQQVHRM